VHSQLLRKRENSLEIAFTIILLGLVLLLYFSNRNNKTNVWCAIAGLIFWLGIVKEAILYNIIPLLEPIFKNNNLHDYFMPVYSVCTWALYSLAMPTSVIFSLYFNNLDITHPKLMRRVKILLYIPAFVLTFIFPPLTFRAYQLSSLPFWITYAVYNLSFGVIFTCFMATGVRIEAPGKKKMQKRYVRLITLPPVLFWMTSVFLTHPFGLTKYFKLWQANAVLLFLCIVIFIVMAFKDGLMGLKLTKESYNWNSDMGLINKGAEYTNHMLKNQTAKMEWCIENLKSQFDTPDNNSELPEELAILERSVSYIKDFTDRIKKHSENIQLSEKSWNLRQVLDVALPVSSQDLHLCILVPDNVHWICDKNHMSEVFSNIIINGIEAAQDTNAIEISGGYDKSKRNYLLSFSDHGRGMSEDEINDMFAPYFTTKNTEKNFGLGLAYCKNAVERHGGTITAKSDAGKGTTVTIAFPANKVEIRDSRAGDEND